MRVDDALRVAGRAARVTHRRGRPFVDLGPLETGRLRGEQLVVAQHVAERGRVAVADHDEVLDRLELAGDLREQRHEAVVDDDHAILGVVDHVGELLGEQPDVERVQHRAHRRHREVGLEVLLRVPQERADPVAGLDPEPRERARQARSARSTTSA